MKTHEGAPFLQKAGWNWQQRDDGFDHCSYCGSIRPEAVFALLSKRDDGKAAHPGVHFSGADWKYGWPHKFYFEVHEYSWFGGDFDGPPPGGTRHVEKTTHLKFYNEHLRDVSDELLAQFSELSEKFFRIRWARDEKGVKYFAAPSNSRYGLQMFGVVGEDGEPDFSLMNPHSRESAASSEPWPAGTPYRNPGDYADGVYRAASAMCQWKFPNGLRCLALSAADIHNRPHSHPFVPSRESAAEREE